MLVCQIRLSQLDLRDKVRFRPGQDGAYWFPVRFGFTGPPPAPAPSVVQAKLQVRPRKVQSNDLFFREPFWSFSFGMVI